MTNLQLELQFQNADFDRLQAAWRSIVQRHPLLQSHLDPEGHLATTEHPDYVIKLYDLSLQSNDKISAVQNKLRADKALTSNQWPWFDLKAVRYDSGNIRLYCAFAADMLDPDQIHYLLRELLALYQNASLPIHSIILNRPDTVTKTNENTFTLRYTHLFGKLEPSTLHALREQSIKHNIALPVVLLNAFKTELDRQNYEYPVYMSLANRFPFYPFMYDRACFATSVAGCEIKDIYSGKFVDNCFKIDSQLRQDSSKITATTLNELVQLPRQLDALALFSCSLEQDLPAGPLFAKIPDIICCNFSLPTVDIDYAVWEQAGQLLYRWSYAKALPMIDSTADQSLLRNAMIEYPELKEIISDNDAAKANNKGKAIAATGLMMAGASGASAAKNKQNNNKNKAALPVGRTETIKQADEENETKNDTFDGLGKSMTALAGSPDAFQEDKQQTEPQNDSGSGQQNPLGDSAAAISIGGGSALLALAIGALKNADLSPSPSPAAPTAREVVSMEPAEVEAAFDDYEKKVIQVHQAPSKSDLAQEDMCAQFTSMADNMGPDMGKVQGELTALGGTMDKVAADMAKGDVKSAAAGVDKLSGDQTNLANKMNAEGMTGSVDDTPLGQSATAVYAASASINDKSSSADVAGLSDKVDALDSAVDNVGDVGKAQQAAAKNAAADGAAAAAKNITNTAEYQNMQAKTDAVKNLGQEIAQYDCDSIIKQASQAKIDQLQNEAAQLELKIPQPTNPLDEKIAATQAKADAVKARAAALKNTNPDLAMQDPGLMSALNDLNASAGDMAANVQGQCPICAATKPNLPAVPKCGHNHADVMKMTNPFHKPTLKLDASINMLNQQSNPKLPAVIEKMKALKSKLQGLNPVPSVPNITNPYSVLKSAVDATKSRVVSLAKNLANCPDAPEEVKQKLSTIESSLTSSQKKLQALTENDTAGDTNKKFTDLQANMKKQTYGKTDGLQSAADKKRQQMLTAAQAGAMANVTSSLACWQAVNMPAMSKGKPDETLVSGFKCKCPSAIGGPVPMMVKPGGCQAKNKEILLVNGIPLNQNMGMCIHLDKTKPIPCVSTILVTGGSKESSNMKFPIATKGTTKLMCPLGAKLQIIDTGQDPKNPLMTP